MTRGPVTLSPSRLQIATGQPLVKNGKPIEELQIIPEERDAQCFIKEV